jgi:hypothetical protein
VEEDEEEEESEDEPEEEGDDEEEDRKPTSTRVILEVEAINDLVRKNCRCPDCNGILHTSLKTTCLATSVSLFCNNNSCGYRYHGPQPAVTDIAAEKNIERMSDYAINCLYVTSFLACGDGGSEASKVLGLLGLHNDTTMEKRSFSIIEDRVAGGIQSLAEDILLENLTEEVRCTATGPNDFDLWKQSAIGQIGYSLIPMGLPVLSNQDWVL